MFHAIRDYVAHELHQLDPKVTAGMGAVFAVAWADTLTRLLGASALAVGIYCSISREMRERRAELARTRGPKCSS